VNGAGTLRFVTGTSGHVRISLFDLSGRLVRTIQESVWTGVGLHRVRIDGRDDAGRSLGSGVYFYRIETPDGSVGGRLMILR